MSKKAELLDRFKDKGHERVMVKWVPKNPYGKRSKVNGWIYRLAGDTVWCKLGDNMEDAVKNLELI
jgi:hypothetical protein